MFFDNLTVTHTRGPILEETHYYPFGLTMAGISSKALNGIQLNRYKFNDKTELDTDLDLNWYETRYRLYDPQIGRFLGIDRFAGITDLWSPYSFAFNNPISLNDPLGLTPEDPKETSTPEKPKELKGVTVIAVKGGLWAKTRLYYDLRDYTGGDVSRIVNNSLREEMLRIDAIVKHREAVNKMTHQSDLIIWGIFLAPIVTVEAGFVLAEAEISALLADAPHILRYMANKKYNHVLRGLLKNIAKRMPVESVKDFERLGAILAAIEKNRDLLKDLKTIGEVKKLVETILKVEL